MSDSREPDVPRGIIEPSAEVVVTMAVADVAHARLDCPESPVPDCGPNMTEYVVNDDYCLSFAGDIAVSGASPIVFAGDAAGTVTLPAVAGGTVLGRSCGGGGGGSLQMRLLWPMLGWSLSE